MNTKMRNQNVKQRLVYMNETDRLSSLEEKVSHLDNAVAKLVVKMEASLEEKREYEKTLRNIDDNVRALSIQMATSSGERHKETEIVLRPIWETIRKHDDRFHKCEIEIKEDIKKDARSHISIVYLFMIVISSLAGYIYINDRTVLIDDVEQNASNIEKHHLMHHK